MMWHKITHDQATWPKHNQQVMWSGDMDTPCSFALTHHGKTTLSKKPFVWFSGPVAMGHDAGFWRPVVSGDYPTP